MRKSTKRLSCTAHHEAGHAVAASMLALRVQRASIEPAEDYLGIVSHPRWPKHLTDALQFGRPTLSQIARLEAHVIVLLAGGIAERQYRGRSNRVGAADDLHKAVDIVMALSGNAKESSAYLTLLHCRAESLVQVHWGAIEAVAQALLSTKTLTGAEVERLIRVAKGLPPERFVYQPPTHA